jgi:hypothetical protein
VIPFIWQVENGTRSIAIIIHREALTSFAGSTNKGRCTGACSFVPSAEIGVRTERNGYEREGERFV